MGEHITPELLHLFAYLKQSTSRKLQRCIRMKKSVIFMRESNI